jgi:hypothetical protein
MDALERYRLGDVQVVLDRNGQVLVNDVLCAQVSVPRRAGEAPEVVTRDELAGELALHRIAKVILDRLDALVVHLEQGQQWKPSKKATASTEGLNSTTAPTSSADRARFGEALVAGLLGEPGELTGDACYRDGFRAGETLRILRDHLQAAAKEQP